MTFQDQSDFPGLSKSWNFQEKKIQDFPGGVGTLNKKKLRVLNCNKTPTCRQSGRYRLSTDSIGKQCTNGWAGHGISAALFILSYR